MERTTKLKLKLKLIRLFGYILCISSLILIPSIVYSLYLMWQVSSNAIDFLDVIISISYMMIAIIQIILCIGIRSFGKDIIKA